jgi:hypothetical protein
MGMSMVVLGLVALIALAVLLRTAPLPVPAEAGEPSEAK